MLKAKDGKYSIIRMLPPGKLNYIYTTFEPYPEAVIAKNSDQKYITIKTNFIFRFQHGSPMFSYKLKTKSMHYINVEVNNNIINNNYYSSGSGQNGESNIDIGISFSEAMNSGITFSDLKLLNE